MIEITFEFLNKASREARLLIAEDTPTNKNLFLGANGQYSIEYAGVPIFYSENEMEVVEKYNSTGVGDNQIFVEPEWEGSRVGQRMPACNIFNGQNSWTLEVDGYSFPFLGSSFAEYLATHYRECGYGVTFNPTPA